MESADEGEGENLWKDLFGEDDEPEDVLTANRAQKEKKEKKEKKDKKDKKEKKAGKEDGKQKKEGKEKPKKDKKSSPAKVGSPSSPASQRPSPKPSTSSPRQPAATSPAQAKREEDVGGADPLVDVAPLRTEKAQKKEKKKGKEGREKKEKKEKKDGKERKDKKEKSSKRKAEAEPVEENLVNEMEPEQDDDVLEELFRGEGGEGDFDMADDMVNMFGEEMVGTPQEHAAEHGSKTLVRAAWLPPRKKKLRQQDDLVQTETEKSVSERFTSTLEHLKGKKALQIAEQDAIEYMQQFVQDMVAAAERDEELVKDGKPAVDKVKFLPKAVRSLGQYQFQNPFVACGGLQAISQWLRPTAAGPTALDIQTHMLKSLQMLPVTLEALEKCEDPSLVEVISEMSKDPQQTVENRKTALSLSARWASLGHDDDGDYAEPPQPKLPRPPPETEESFELAEQESFKRMHPRIPQIVQQDLVIQPMSDVEPVKRIKLAEGSKRAKLNETLKKLSAPNKRSYRPWTVSVAGRTVNAL